MQRGLLRIAKVTQEDAGIYVCDASNVEGAANGTASLEIKGIVDLFSS